MRSVSSALLDVVHIVDSVVLVDLDAVFGVVSAAESDLVPDVLHVLPQLLGKSLVLLLRLFVLISLGLLLVMQELGFRFGLLQLALGPESISEVSNQLLRLLALQDLNRRWKAEPAELLNRLVVQVEPILVFVVELGWSVTVLPTLLGSGRGIRLAPIALTHGDLDLFSLQLVLQLLFGGFPSLFVAGLLQFFNFSGLLAFGLPVLGTEVNELLASFDLLLVRVNRQSRELLELPLSLALLFPLPPFLLASSVFLLLLRALLLHTLPMLSLLSPLCIEHLSSLFTLGDHLLRLRDPDDVLDEGLLDFVVAQLAVEVLLQIALLSAQLTDVLQECLHGRIDVDEIQLVELLLVDEPAVALFDFADFCLDRACDLVDLRQVGLDLSPLFLQIAYFPVNCVHLLEIWNRVLHLLNLLNYYCFFGSS